MAQLRFFKQNTAPTGERLVAGSIWFNTSDKTIEVYTGSAWEKYAGKLTNAEWNNDTQKLTISKADGSSIALDFSNIASLSGVQAALIALKNELTPLINAAQDAADAAQTHSEGVADDLSDEVTARTEADTTLGQRIDGVETNLNQEITNRTNADTALDNRLTEVEDKVASLATVTHFIGVKDSLPATGADGDVVIVGNKEYIYDTTKGWVELGDTTEELQRIAAAEGKITNLEGKVDVEKVSTAISGAIAALDSEKASTEGTDYHVKVTVKETDGKIESVTVAEKDIASAAALATAEGKITTLEGKVGNSNVADQIVAKINELNADVDSTGGDKVSVNVTQVNGKVTEVTVEETDIASEAALNAAIGRITTLEGKVDVTKVSTAISNAIAGLNSDAISADEGHVRVKVTLTEGEVTAVEVTEKDIASAAELTTAKGDIDALEARMDTVEAGLQWENFV